MPLNPSNEHKPIAFIVAGAPHAQLKEVVYQRYPATVSTSIFVGVDAGCLEVLNASFALHVAIGDFDSVWKEEFDRIQRHAQTLISLPSEKDETDLEHALLYVHTHYPDYEIHVLGVFSGRLDHELATLWLPFRLNLHTIVEKLYFENETNVLRFVHAGTHTIQAIKGMSYWSCISYGPIKNLTLTQMKYPLTNASYDYPVAFVSNEYQEDTMTVSFEEGLLLIIQSKDEKRER